MSQFQLLRERRFGPFFWTQFLGAFNDNVYKNALIILIAFQFSSGSGNEGNVLINAAAGLFILPFFLFSATAGQLADKFPKDRLIRLVKLAEILIMLAAAAALALRAPYALIGLLFLMGAQSSLFGPVKYSILPQTLRDDELVGGNGMVEMGTFVAILMGTLCGGLLIALDGIGVYAVGAAVVLIAIAGWWTSRGIPECPAADADLPIRGNFLAETWDNLRSLAEDRAQLLTAIAISWFWFYGATLLTQIPNYTRLSLYGNEQVVTLLLTLFSLGIGMGSLLVESLARRKIVLWISLVGAAGLTLFGLLLYWGVQAVSPSDSLRGAGAFLSAGGLWILLGVPLLGISGGLYIVPLFALIQRRAPVARRSRVIAGVNILNALFMVASAILAGGLLAAGLDIPALFAAVALLNLLALMLLQSLRSRLVGDPALAAS